MNMRKKTIAVLFGGCSTEYEVSLQSASAVIQSIDSEKYNIVRLGITREGTWYKYDGAVDQILDNTWMHHPSCVRAVISPDRQTHGILVLEEGSMTVVRIDAAFPVLHGKNGEDGTLQGLLEIAGIPCVGCGVLSSAVCMDKDIAHRLVQAAGIPTPPSAVIYSRMTQVAILKKIHALEYPLFVKPANAGSSFGISKTINQMQLFKAITVAFQHDVKVVIEEAIEGFEVGCAVLGNEELIIGEVDEIELGAGFFDYTEKYTLRTSRIHMPARISSETAACVKQTATKIYRTLECRGFVRVDMFLTPKDEIIFNEVNTIPGFTAHSRYPNMLKGIGMSFAGIVDTLINLAVRP
jgi:D-alanine---D-serine ligase